MARSKPSQDKLDALGIQGVCERISDGKTLTAIAGELGIAFAVLNGWLEADPERSARAREARRATAKLWDERAAAAIEAAADPFALAKAKELAFHYRWRSSKIAPSEYGDKVAVEHSGEMALRSAPDDKLRSELAELLATKTGDGDSPRIGQAEGKAQD